MMVQAGLVDEVQSLMNFKSRQPLNTVGYKEIFAHLDGEYSLDRAIELIKRNSRRYAKRQLTWLRRNPDLVWVKYHEIDRVKEVVQERLEKVNN